MSEALTAQDIRTLQLALRYLSDRRFVSYNAMPEAIARAATDRAVKAKAQSLGITETPQFTVSKSVIAAFGKGNTTTIQGKGVLLGVYLWLRAKHAAAWDHAQARTLKKKTDPFVTGLREIYGRDAIDPGKIEALTGAYALYRPHFLNPGAEVMRCALQIGVDKNRYACTLQMKYAIGRETVTVTAKGKIVPNQDRATVILSDGVQGAFILYVDALTRAGDRNHALTLAGTLIASADNRQSGASPFMAIREAQQVEPGLIRRDHRLPPEVRARLSFGLVEWDPDRLGRSIRKLEPKPDRPRRAKLPLEHRPDQPEPVPANGAHKPG